MNRTHSDLRKAQSSGAEPLADFRLFRSRDLDETRNLVARVFKPHDLHIENRRQRLDTFMDHAPIGANTSLNRLCYGADVLIQPDRLDDFLLVQMPLQGQATIRCGDQTVESHTRMASVLTPSLPLTMHWRGECDQLIVRITRNALESMCGAHLGHALPSPLEFKLGMDTSSRQGLVWQQLVHTLAGALTLHNGSLPPLLAAHYEQLLIATLLSEHPHNYSQELATDAPPAAPAHIQRAQAYLHAHSDHAITIDDLARHTAVSARSLYKGFQAHYGTSPMAYLRLIRLQKVHNRLQQARRDGEPIRITQLALDHGFAHLGHFNHAYKRQFGVTPGQTLGQSSAPGSD